MLENKSKNPEHFRPIEIVKNTPMVPTRNFQDRPPSKSPAAFLPLNFLEDVSDSSESLFQKRKASSKEQLFNSMDEEISCRINQVKVESYKCINRCLQPPEEVKPDQINFNANESGDLSSLLKKQPAFEADQIQGDKKLTNSLQTISLNNSLEQVSPSMLSMINRLETPENYLLQQKIDAAPPFSTILLPPCPVTVSSLFINKPVLFQGQIESSLNVTKTILVKMEKDMFQQKPNAKVKFQELKIVFTEFEPEYQAISTNESPDNRSRVSLSEPMASLFHISPFTRLEFENCSVECKIHTEIRQKAHLKTLDKVRYTLNLNSNLNEVSALREDDSLWGKDLQTIAFKIQEGHDPICPGQLTIRSSIVKNFSCFLSSNSGFDFAFFDTHFEDSQDNAIHLRDPLSLTVENARFIQSGLSAVSISFTSNALQVKKERRISFENAVFVKGGGSGISLKGNGLAWVPVSLFVSKCMFTQLDSSAIFIKNFSGISVLIENNKLKSKGGFGVHFENVFPNQNLSLPALKSNKILQNSERGGVCLENSSSLLENNEIFENQEGIIVIAYKKDKLNKRPLSPLKSPESCQEIQKGSEDFIFGTKSMMTCETKYDEENLCGSTFSARSKESFVKKESPFACTVSLKGNNVHSNTCSGLFLILDRPSNISVKDCLFIQNENGVKLREKRAEKLPEPDSVIQFSSCKMTGNRRFGLFLERVQSMIQNVETKLKENGEGAIFAYEKSQICKLKKGRNSFAKTSITLEIIGPWGKIPIQEGLKGCSPCDSRCQVF